MGEVQRMAKVIIVGEVVSTPKLSRRKGGELFLSLVVRENKGVIKLYANTLIAVHIHDKITKGMIVWIEAKLNVSWLSKFRDTFTLGITNIHLLWIKTPDINEAESEERSIGLNGKPLPFENN